MVERGNRCIRVFVNRVIVRIVIPSGIPRIGMERGIPSVVDDPPPRCALPSPPTRRGEGCPDGWLSLRTRTAPAGRVKQSPALKGRCWFAGDRFGLPQGRNPSSRSDPFGAMTVQTLARHPHRGHNRALSEVEAPVPSSEGILHSVPILGTPFRMTAHLYTFTPLHSSPLTLNNPNHSAI